MAINTNFGEILPLRTKTTNNEMAPTCDWMIKIVKVNKLYLNSLLVSIVNRVSRSERIWNINVKTLMSQTRNGYLHNEEKVESILLSEVVQR